MGNELVWIAFLALFLTLLVLDLMPHMDDIARSRVNAFDAVAHSGMVSELVGTFFVALRRCGHMLLRAIMYAHGWWRQARAVRARSDQLE